MGKKRGDMASSRLARVCVRHVAITLLRLRVIATSVAARGPSIILDCENATTPSPRSERCGRWPLEVRNGWHAFHGVLVEDAATHVATPVGRSLVLIGDSITEAFRGTARGIKVARTLGMEETLQALTALYKSRPLVLAISGDETQHLLWRLETELSPSLRADPRLDMALLIGTNNRANAKHSANETAAGIIAVASLLLTRTHGRLLVHALLPRGKDPKLANRRRATPYTSFMPKVLLVNAIVARAIGTLSAAFPGRVRSIDCGHLFVPLSNGPNASEVNLDRMRTPACTALAFLPGAWQASWRAGALKRTPTRVAATGDWQRRLCYRLNRC